MVQLQHFSLVRTIEPVLLILSVSCFCFIWWYYLVLRQRMYPTIFINRYCCEHYQLYSFKLALLCCHDALLPICRLFVKDWDNEIVLLIFSWFAHCLCFTENDKEIERRMVRIGRLVYDWEINSSRKISSPGFVRTDLVTVWNSLQCFPLLLYCCRRFWKYFFNARFKDSPSHFQTVLY